MNSEAALHPDLVASLQQRLPEAVIITDLDQIADLTRSDSPLARRHQPHCVVRPANHDELQSLVALANEIGLNLTVTSSTGVHRNCGSTGSSESVHIDLSAWCKIDLIDRRNRVCRIEPGVTYGQLTAELSDHGMTVPMPLAPRDGKSVLASVMDREPTTWPNKQWDASDPVGSTEYIFGNGQRFRTGAAGGPGSIAQQRQSGGAQKFSSGPSQSDFHRVVQGAQGTMGIINWITIRCELKPTVQQTLLAGSETLRDLLPLIYGVQRGLLGEEAFILDRTAAALLVARGSRPEFERTVHDLPRFVYVQNAAGFERLAHERLEYHLADIGAIASGAGIHLEDRIGTISAADLLNRATQPCGQREWRDSQYGSSLSIFFLTTLDRVPQFVDLFEAHIASHGLAQKEFGIYIQPVVQNHACHVEFILPFEPDSDNDIRRVTAFEAQAVSELMQAGAFFSRPYGTASNLVWDRNLVNYQLVKSVKSIFDPNRVLQRGKWGL